ncbi:MAG: tRNA (adenosine(37)-N6)-threonylcarbamoyltransferase complex dimerization subunit type 1 TsaB [Pyrinomonadaceae bacterium]
MANVDDNYLLAIESAISGGSIALFNKGDFVYGASGGNSVSRAEDLLPRIIELLTEAGLSVGQLKKVGVSLGPGSYTGLRIGIATVMGLCRGLGVDYVGIPVFDAIAWSREDRSSIIALPMGRSDICVTGAAVENTTVTTLDGLKALITQSRPLHLLAHSDLVPDLTDIRTDVVDIGRNLARFVGAAAFDRPRSSSLDPIYVHNPRFG